MRLLIRKTSPTQTRKGRTGTAGVGMQRDTGGLPENRHRPDMRPHAGHLDKRHKPRRQRLGEQPLQRYDGCGKGRMHEGNTIRGILSVQLFTRS